MPAPAAAVVQREVPDGTHLFDGFTTFVGLELATDIKLWEKRVTPPAIDGREPIDQTTFWNINWTLVTPRALMSLNEFTMTCAYEPEVYQMMVLIINIVQGVGVTFPDGTGLRFWAFVRKFEPQEHTEGSQPEAVVTITPSLMDPAHPELSPVIVPPLFDLTPGT